MALPVPLGGSRPTNKNILLKIVILGDGGVGKSCLMNRYVNNHFDDHSFHTIGVEFLNKDIEINSEMYTMQIWDTAGQERFKSLRTPFYRGSDICMLTFAVDDQTSFRNLTMWRNEFLYYADIKDGATFPFIVVANKFSEYDSSSHSIFYWKMECEEELYSENYSSCKNMEYFCNQVDVGPDKRLVSESEIQGWCQENGRIPYIETSAKDAVNVDTAFALGVESWSHLEESLDRVDKYPDNTIHLSRHNRNRKRSTCCTFSD